MDIAYPSLCLMKLVWYLVLGTQHFHHIIEPRLKMIDKSNYDTFPAVKVFLIIVPNNRIHRSCFIVGLALYRYGNLLPVCSFSQRTVTISHLPIIHKSSKVCRVVQECCRPPSVRPHEEGPPGNIGISNSNVVFADR